MISAINTNNSKVNFHGTTIIKKAGVQLSKEMQEAVDMSTLGYHNPRLTGYTLVVVDSLKFFDKEAAYLEKLRNSGIDYVNSTKTFDWKMLGGNGIIKMIEKVLAAGLL